MFPSGGLHLLLHASEQELLRFRAAILTLFAVVALFSGCKQSQQPVTDAAKAPWLLDPQSQIKSLKDGNFRIRGIAAFNLGNMGAKAAEAVPALDRLAHEDPNDKVRENAREAVEKIRAAKQ